MGTCQALDDEQIPTEIQITRNPGAMQRTLRSVIRIQSVWRGFIFRKKMRSSNVFLVSARLKPFQYDSEKLPSCIMLRVPMHFPEGVFSGEWNSQKRIREGRGVLEFKDGGRYEGHWLKDKPNGRGRRIYPSGDVYEGQWVDGSYHGEGVLTTFRIGTYTGEWKKGRRHGKGSEIWIDGSKYTGDYCNGAKHGYGEFIWPDGAVYKGQFVRGVLDGVGSYTWPDQSSYQGDWVLGQMHGVGTFRWKDGRVFEGSFANDLREGKGRLRLVDGSVFEGVWRAGRPEAGDGGTGEQSISVILPARIMEESQIWSTSNSDDRT